MLIWHHNFHVVVDGEAIPFTRKSIYVKYRSCIVTQSTYCFKNVWQTAAYILNIYASSPAGKYKLKQRRTSTLKRHSILLKRINVEIWRCFNVEIWRCFTVEIWRCFIVKILRCCNVEIWRCFNVEIWLCFNVMFKASCSHQPSIRIFFHLDYDRHCHCFPCRVAPYSSYCGLRYSMRALVQWTYTV